MGAKVKWGILGVADIATAKVIPALQAGSLTEVVAIASRDAAKAKEAAKRLGIPRSYGSYEELLADREIEVIYNPLPNNLHVTWSILAAQAGKHVLCEKPLAMNAKEAQRLIQVRDKTGVKIGEGFMVRTHPQWLEARKLAHSPDFGELRAVMGFFGYCLTDPGNIRNIRSTGGGGIYDIGVYPIHTTRFVWGEEPERVVATLEWDPVMKIDRLGSVIMEFARGAATFMTSTQAVSYQRMQFFGTSKRLEIEIPFVPTPDWKCRLFLDSGDQTGKEIRVIELAACNQYTIEGDKFSEAVLSGGEVPVPLEDSLNNMKVVDAIFRSAASGRWAKV